MLHEDFKMKYHANIFNCVFTNLFIFCDIDPETAQTQDKNLKTGHNKKNALRHPKEKNHISKRFPNILCLALAQGACSPSFSHGMQR